jgi:hypothetical protein
LHTHNLILSVNRLPAGLNQTGDVAAHRRFTQLVAAQAKLTINRVGATGDLAAALLADRAGITWQLLQGNLGDFLAMYKAS